MLGETPHESLVRRSMKPRRESFHHRACKELEALEAGDVFGLEEIAEAGIF